MTISGDLSPANRVSAPPRKRFTLSGRSAKLDERTDAVRADLADVSLADRVFAPHYAQSVAWRTTASAPILAKAGGLEAPLSTLEKGSSFDVFDFSAGWAWGRGAGAVGYVDCKLIEPA